MAARQIELTEPMDHFVEEQLNTGRFESVTEVVRAGLRLLEQQIREDEQKLELLKSLAMEATDQLDQGQGISIGDERQLKSFIAAIGRRAAVNSR